MENQTNDIIKFAEEFMYIYNPIKGEYEKIKLFDYQKNLLKDFENNKFTIIKQSRQVGLDTAVQIYMAYLMKKNSNKNFFVISNSPQCASEFLKKVKGFLFNIEEIPIKMNKKELVLKNGTKLFATSNTNHTRSKQTDFVYANNFEFIKDSEQMLMGLTLSLMSTSGKLIISSVPQYKNDYFYNLWTNAEKKVNNFKPISVSWTQRPDFNEEWYQNYCRGLNYNQNWIKTELDGEFIDKPEKKKNTSICIRLKEKQKNDILKKMKQKKISSITDYIMELIDKDLE